MDSAVRVDVSLAVGDVSQSVEVSADATLLQAERFPQPGGGVAVRPGTAIERAQRFEPD